MREILFKAKRTDNGEWVEGYYLQDGVTGKVYIVQSGTCLNESEKVGEDGCLQFFAFEVDPSTICQYTGLRDKNGKKIWENDIIRCGGNMMVSWREDKASWILSKKGWLYNHFFGESVEPEDVEVIGNIFDNQELLEQSSEG